ncbi:carboxyl transferase domain-containing protein, partial [Aphelenchoides avenae]
GQILSPKELTETWEVELAHNGCKYSVLVNRYGPINFMVCLNENKIATELRELGNGTLLVTYSDQAYTCYLEEEPERFKVSIGKTLTIFEKENDPSVLRSPNAGKLLNYLKKDGERVSVGETYAEMESMKMVVTLQVKKAGGKIVWVAQPGQVLFPGTLIARLEDQSDTASAKPVDFAGTIEEWQAATERQQRAAAAQRLNLKFDTLLQSCNDMLSGYAVPEPFFKDYVQKLVDDLFEVLNNEDLPYALFKVMFNVVVNRINKVATTKKINALLKPSGAFPASDLTDVMEEYLSGLNPAEVGVEKQYFEGLLKICERFQDGLEGHKKLVVDDLLTTFLGTERYFQEEVPYDKGVAAMKAQVSDAQKIVRMVYSHTRVLSKNTLMIEILGRLDHSLVVSLQPTFKKIANLSNKETEPLALYVRKIINGMHQINYEEVCTNLSRKSSQRSLSDLVKLCSENGGDTLLRGFDSENPLVLHEFFFTPNKETNKYAIKTFIRRTFYVEDANIDVVSTEAKYHIFKFEITSDSPLYAHAVRGAVDKQSKVFYFLSVLSEMDLFRHEKVVNELAKHAEEKAHNNFLFISYSTGANGFSTAMTWDDKTLRDAGRKLRDEIGSLLVNAKAITGQDAADAVDLMLSRPSNPPLYTGFDFSMKEKLELYRLPAEARQIELPKSPFLLYRHDDCGVQRIFLRCLLRDVASVLRVEKYSSVKPLDLLREKIVEVIDGACGEIRVCTAAAKPREIYSCHHMLICLDYEPELNSKDWHVAIQDAVRQCSKQLTKHRVTKMEITYQARTQNQ